MPLLKSQSNLSVSLTLVSFLFASRSMLSFPDMLPPVHPPLATLWGDGNRSTCEELRCLSFNSQPSLGGGAPVVCSAGGLSEHPSGDSLRWTSREMQMLEEGCCQPSKEPVHLGCRWAGCGPGSVGEILAVCVCCNVYPRLRRIRRYEQEAMGTEWRTQGMMLGGKRAVGTEKIWVRLEDLSS